MSTQRTDTWNLVVARVFQHRGIVCDVCHAEVELGDTYAFMRTEPAYTHCCHDCFVEMGGPPSARSGEHFLG